MCSVQFSPTNSNLMAFGSANYRVYLYDLRQVRLSVCLHCSDSRGPRPVASCLQRTKDHCPLGFRAHRSLGMCIDVSSCVWFCVPVSCVDESDSQGGLTSTSCLLLLTLNHQTVLPVLASAFLTCQAWCLLHGNLHACVIACVHLALAPSLHQETLLGLV